MYIPITLVQERVRLLKSVTLTINFKVKEKRMVRAGL